MGVQSGRNNTSKYLLKKVGCGNLLEGIVSDFIFLGYKFSAESDYSHEIKNTCSLEDKLWPT